MTEIDKLAEIERLPWPLCLTDDELRREELIAADAVSSRGIQFAVEFAGGASYREASARAGLATSGNASWRFARRPAVQRLITLFRERGRRAAALTVAGAIGRFQHLSRKAEESGEFGMSIAADKEAAKIANLYPQESPSGVGTGSVNVTVALALPERLHPPSFLQVAVARPALPVPAAPEELDAILR